MSAQSIEPGKLLAGKYEVVSCVGEGGMGRVFSARHRALGHMVAVKTTRPEVAAEHAARFLEEGRASARIQSEHVARVVDVGVEETSKAPYMVMEYLEGQTLTEVLGARGPIPYEQAIAWLLEACEGIAEAHALGIVHRDLKPDNLFLSERRFGPPVLKVLDFGVAKLGHESEPERTVVGTPQYMSPEQMCGCKVDARTDVWSLGVVLYELLTGAVPFDGPTVDKVASEVMFAPVPPVRASRPDVPEGVQRVIERCLARKPHDRFASVGELAAALADFSPEAARTSLPRIPIGADATSHKPRRAHPVALAHTVRVLPPRRRAWLPWLAAVGICVSFVLGAAHGDGRLTEASSAWRRALTTSQKQADRPSTQASLEVAGRLH